MSEPHDGRAVSFGKAVDAYDRGRPPYPDAAVDWMLPAGARRVLDLGAGTGKPTRSLVARGLETLAVDPSPEMLARLRSDSPAWTPASARPRTSRCRMPVSTRRWWARPGTGSTRRARSPRSPACCAPAGTLAPVWNVRDDRVAWVAQLSGSRGRPRPDLYRGAGRRSAVRSPASLDVAWSYDIDETTFGDLARSRSETIGMSEAERETLLAQLRMLFEAQADKVVLSIPYVAHAFRCCVEAN